MNKNKIILDLCGGTGAWSRPYKEAGYTVYNITLPDYDVRESYPFNGMADDSFEHNQGRFPMIHFGGPDKSLNIAVKDIYGILAAPPCTMFSLARTRAKKPRDFGEGMEIVEACLNVIWHVRKRKKIAFWAMENPTGYLRQFLGKPALTFNPFDFGDPYPKRTDIWGYFNEPTKKPVKPVLIQDSVRHKNYSLVHFKTGGNSEKSKRLRGITPAGFANAFYKANK